MSHDEFRRDFLLRTLAVGAFAASPSTRAELSGRMPRQLTAGASIYSLRGELSVIFAVGRMPSSCARRANCSHVKSTYHNAGFATADGKIRSATHHSDDELLLTGARRARAPIEVIEALVRRTADVVTVMD